MRTFHELVSEDAIYDKSICVERREYALRMRSIIAHAANPKTWTKFIGIHSADHLLNGLHEAEALQCEAAPIISEFVVRIYPHQMEVEQMHTIQRFALDAGEILRKYGVDECDGGAMANALDSIAIAAVDNGSDTPGGGL